MNLADARLAPAPGADGLVSRTPGAVLFVASRTPAAEVARLVEAVASHDGPTPGRLLARQLATLVGADEGALPGFALVAATEGGTYVKAYGSVELRIQGDEQAEEVISAVGSFTGVDREVQGPFHTIVAHRAGEASPAPVFDVDLRAGTAAGSGFALTSLSSPTEAQAAEPPPSMVDETGAEGAGPSTATVVAGEAPTQAWSADEVAAAGEERSDAPSEAPPTEGAPSTPAPEPTSTESDAPAMAVEPDVGAGAADAPAPQAFGAQAFSAETAAAPPTSEPTTDPPGFPVGPAAAAGAAGAVAAGAVAAAVAGDLGAGDSAESDPEGSAGGRLDGVSSVGPPGAGSDAPVADPVADPVPAPAEAAFTSQLLGALDDEDAEDREPLPVELDPADVRAPEQESADVMVQGVLCSRGHFNDPRSRFCSSCGISMVQNTQVLTNGPRPPLGVMVFEDGATFSLAQDYVVGRQPEVSDLVRDGLALPLMVDDPERSISRAHAELRLVDWDVHLVNLSATNGSFVWDDHQQQWIPIPTGQSVVLAAGMRVALGRRSAVFESSLVR